MNSTKYNNETLLTFLKREGIGDKQTYKDWFQNHRVKINQTPVTEDYVIKRNDKLSIRGKKYLIMESGEPGRLTIKNVSNKAIRIKGKVRAHCGYHKCLTVYSKRISRKTSFVANPFSKQFRHFFHRLDEFYYDCNQHSISSVSGHCLDLERFDDIKAVHVIRDPRDLLVSGYFYHKRAAEDWCEYLNSNNNDWKIVNASVPDGIPANISFGEYLNQETTETGLISEFEFRRLHFEAMLKWPVNDARVLTVKYEDILGNEPEVFRKIYDFYEFPFHVKQAAVFFANRYSSKSKFRKSSHIRNSQHGQWKELFSNDLNDRFVELYGDLLDKYDYPRKL